MPTMDPTQKSNDVTHWKTFSRSLKSRAEPQMVARDGRTSTAPVQAPAAIPWQTSSRESGRESHRLAHSQAKSPSQGQSVQDPPLASSSMPVSSSYLSMDLFSPPRRGYHGHKQRNKNGNSGVHHRHMPNAAAKSNMKSNTMRQIRPQYYAVDAEMVMAVGPGDAPERRVMVSVGIVNQRLETVLYSRVRVPDGCHVTNGAFARVQGGLWASWEEGVPASCISDLLKRHVSDGGVIVGWELHGDLEVIGFEKAAALVKDGHREDLPIEVAVSSPSQSPSSSPSPRESSRVVDQEGEGRPTRAEQDVDNPAHGADSPTSPENHREGEARTWSKDASPPPEEAKVRGMKVVEVTDHFRTSKSGLKCMLSEAYATCFDRKGEGVHNAATDARMTMELYNLWRRVGEPKIAIGIPLSLFMVNFHSFESREIRKTMLWEVLRPERTGRQILLEKDSGVNTYKLCFRSERERDAYITLLESRMAAAGLAWDDKVEEVPGRRGAWGGYQLCCPLFKMHVMDTER